MVGVSSSTIGVDLLTIMGVLLFYKTSVFSTSAVLSGSWFQDLFIEKSQHRELHLIFYSNILWRRRWHPTPVLLPGKSDGLRSLVGCSPWGHWGSDTTERLHFHFSLSCLGEGNGNPLQCSCLENPRDGGAWWAAVYGVAQSRTRLKWLSSSSSSNDILCNIYIYIYITFLYTWN